MSGIPVKFVMIYWPKWKSDVKLPSWPETEPKTNVRQWCHDLVLNVVFAGYGGELLLTLSMQTVWYLFGVMYLWVLCLLWSYADSKKSTFFCHITINYRFIFKKWLVLMIWFWEMVDQQECVRSYFWPKSKSEVFLLQISCTRRAVFKHWTFLVNVKVLTKLRGKNLLSVRIC